MAVSSVLMEQNMVYPKKRKKKPDDLYGKFSRSVTLENAKVTSRVCDKTMEKMEKQLN